MKMKLQEIADMIDHSLLRPELTTAEIVEGCRLADKYNCVSICCRPSDVKLCTEVLRDSKTIVTTVIGFPHGSNPTEVKTVEAEIACKDGAVELDMVINIGRLLSGDYKYVEDDIRSVCDTAVKYGAIVKVILENCYLNDEQKHRACKISEQAGAAFVKTSTGFGMPKNEKASGATVEDLKLMRRSCNPAVRIKAAGGVRTLSGLLEMKAAGADRIGATATKSIMEEAKQRELEGKLEIV